MESKCGARFSKRHCNHVRSIPSTSGSFVPSRVWRCAVLRAGPDGGIRNTTANMEPASEVLAQTAPIDVPADWASTIETEEVIPYHTRYYRKRG
jgi:hypothetical protein